MPAIYEENITTRKGTKPRPVFSSLGLVIPFQPSMWDEKTIQAVWNYEMGIVETKLKEKYSAESTDKVFATLNKIFAQLNFNTHRKNLAIILTAGEEKVIYLDFSVKTVVFFSRSVSLFDLVFHLKQEPDFYFLVFNKRSVALYDYNNKHLSKMYEQKHETNTVHSYKNVSGLIEILNCKNEKPVFIAGNTEQLEAFCNAYPFPEIILKQIKTVVQDTDEKIQTLVTKIINHWSYWQCVFISGKILIAQKAGSLICHIDAVMQAMHKKADGLLLIDKRLKKRLSKSGTGKDIFHISKELMHEIEHFLIRGNHIEITETDLLKDMGGIVLLRNSASGIPEGQLYSIHSEVTGVDSLF